MEINLAFSWRIFSQKLKQLPPDLEVILRLGICGSLGEVSALSLQQVLL